MPTTSTPWPSSSPSSSSSCSIHHPSPLPEWDFWAPQVGWIAFLVAQLLIHEMGSAAETDKECGAGLVESLPDPLVYCLYYSVLYIWQCSFFNPPPSSLGWGIWFRPIKCKALISLRKLGQGTSIYVSTVSRGGFRTYVREEPAVSYKWTGWVRAITGWGLRLEEIYRSF